MTTTTEPDVHRADPTRIDQTADARARLALLGRRGAPVPLEVTVHEDPCGASAAITVSPLPSDELARWIAMSDDPSRPPVDHHVWVGPAGWRVWYGHLAGLPVTVWALDPDASRPGPDAMRPALVALRPSPRARRALFADPGVDDPERTGEHDVVGYSAALDAAAAEHRQGGAR